jgi:hypothetical protein
MAVAYDARVSQMTPLQAQESEEQDSGFGAAGVKDSAGSAEFAPFKRCGLWVSGHLPSVECESFHQSAGTVVATGRNEGPQSLRAL